MASGVEVTLTTRLGYRDMRNNESMAARFGEHMKALGREPMPTAPRVGAGSTDMGDVSHVVPSIHPYVAICAEGEAAIHQRPFAELAGTKRGFDGMLLAAKAMARTAADVLADEALRAELRRGFEDAKR